MAQPNKPEFCCHQWPQFYPVRYRACNVIRLPIDLITFEAGKNLESRVDSRRRIDMQSLICSLWARERYSRLRTTYLLPQGKEYTEQESKIHRRRCGCLFNDTIRTDFRSLPGLTLGILLQDVELPIPEISRTNFRLLDTRVEFLPRCCGQSNLSPCSMP